MHDPRDQHLALIKRVVRYVMGTLSHGLQLLPSATDSLITYTDAHWAGCPDTRRSTSSYCIFLGDNLVSWCGDPAYHCMCSIQVVDITPMKHRLTSITSIRVVQQKYRRSKVGA
jgi:hypothetical protein